MIIGTAHLAFRSLQRPLAKNLSQHPPLVRSVKLMETTGTAHLVFRSPQRLRVKSRPLTRTPDPSQHLSQRMRNARLTVIIGIALRGSQSLPLRRRRSLLPAQLLAMKTVKSVRPMEITGTALQVSLSRPLPRESHPPNPPPRANAKPMETTGTVPPASPNRLLLPPRSPPTQHQKKNVRLTATTGTALLESRSRRLHHPRRPKSARRTVTIGTARQACLSRPLLPRIPVL